MGFVHLHNHSQYSLLDALMSVEELAKKAKELEQSAVALTDHMNLFGAIDFYKTCKSTGIQPIIGCEAHLAPTSRFEKRKIAGYPYAFHVILLCKDATGYKNLCKLSSAGYTEGFYYTPRIDFELLEKHSEGLLCLSGCMHSEFAFHAKKGDMNAFQEAIRRFHKLFGQDFYLEVQRHNMSIEDIQLDNMQEEPWLYQQHIEYIQQQDAYNKKLIEIGQTHHIPLVATNNCHYVEQSDWKAHEILINIQSGEPCEIWERDIHNNPKFLIPNPKRTTFPSHEMFFKTEDEMRKLFHDIPHAIDNTLEIAKKCHLQLDFTTKHYPVYIPPTLSNTTYTPQERLQAVEEYLLHLCTDAIPRRYTEERLKKVAEQYPGEDPLTVVKKRLDYEMTIITSKGMSDYLLIVWDFIHWAKNQKIPMGPGRGSGAGSIILYLTGITDIEPLRFNLFFERFINPERLSYPDIDVDICMARRNDVINYTTKKYGQENVAQIITFGTMKAKMSIKDVGRVLSVALQKVNLIAKLIPEDLNMTIEKALTIDPDLKSLYAQDNEAKKIIDIAKRLEGCIRNTGIHAAGMIVSGAPLTEHIPICTAKDATMLVTQFSMKPAEMVGMLKIDFLGLKTLTSIQVCCDAILHNRNLHVDWTDLPLDDKETFSLLNHGKTHGVFQLESGGMQELAKQLHLDSFEEIIAVLSLYRPGPMDMIPSFIQRKHGREQIESDHPWMDEILKETYGIMVYQEQVMQIASRLANYSLGEGDVLRRAMGKKDMTEMANQRKKFTQGALINGIAEDVANRIFDKMEKFAAYGFNKSHAAAYGYLTYVTAYLKAHYPAEWLASLMTCDRDDIEKVARYIDEGQQIGIHTLPPHINESQMFFTAHTNGIRFALSAIKGVGTNVVEAIVQERNAKGAYLHLYDFISRVDMKRVGKKSIELLVDSGAFDFTSWPRDELKASIESMYEEAQRRNKEKTSGYLSLFAQEEDTASHFMVKKPSNNNHTACAKDELLFREKELLGLFLTGHPLDSFQGLIQQLGGLSLAKAKQLETGTIFRCAFIIEAADVRLSSKTQKKFAILTISDGSINDEGKSRFELPIWSDLYDKETALIANNKLVWAILATEKKDETIQFSCKWICDLKTVDDKKVEESDIAFDKWKAITRARSMQRPYAPRANKKPQGTPPPAQQEIKQATPVILCFDLEKTRLSHILQLKSILQAAPGTTPLQIKFMQNLQPIAVLHLDTRFHVHMTDNMKEQLSRICACLDPKTEA